MARTRSSFMCYWQPVRMQETRMCSHKLTTRLSAVLAALALLGALVLPPTSRAAGKVQIITATTDLAALAQEVGGDKIEVESIARGYQDPHFVDAKPSFLLKLKRADLLIVVGLELEIDNDQEIGALELERSEEHTSELQSHLNLVCRLLLEKKKQIKVRTVQLEAVQLLVQRIKSQRYDKIAIVRSCRVLQLADHVMLQHTRKASEDDCVSDS